jgi:NAD(P)-dependent dehydrogenase (short-subunit alcohol dehydrogenase family)
MTTLIFGATGGVGAALARSLSKSGKDVFLAARDEEALKSIADELDAPSQVCDVLDSAEIEATVEAAAEHGALTGLAFCVGSIELAPLRRTDRDMVRKTFELNAVSASEALRCAGPHLCKNNGSAVLFSTVAVSQGFVSHASISMAKGAVEGLTRAVAAEWAPKARINTIAPSILDTGIAQPLLSSDKMRDGLAKMHAMERLGEGNDAAALAAFLLSKESGWITGQVFPVDGGRSRVRTKG